jgi:heat shock protein HspQ
MASSSPPKNAPWYRVMVHNANYTTYVSQQNLLEDSSAKQINHPELGKHFGYFIDGQYIKKKTFN